MIDTFMESRVQSILMYFNVLDGLKNQSEGIKQIKSTKAIGNIGIAIFAIIFGVLAILYGFADVFGGKKLPMGVIFLLCGPIACLGGIYMILVSTSRVVKSSIIEFETNLERLCMTFYANVFCKKTTDFSSKDDHIIDVCQFIPMPVLENYKVEKGWDDLAQRWLTLRRSITGQDIDFSLISVDIDSSPRSDSRVIDITINLNGIPFGKLSIINIAFNINGYWFLASPEPNC